MFRFLLVPILFFSPVIDVRQNIKTVNIKLSGEDELMDDCINSGFELRYRFEFQVCEKNHLWFDSCPRVKLENHFLTFDNLSGTYKIVIDRFYDNHQPRTYKTDSKEDALEFMNLVNKVPLLFMADGDKELAHSTEAYISTRVYSECYGEYNKTFARLSKIVTLGFARINGFDTGWEDFPVD